MGSFGNVATKIHKLEELLEKSRIPKNNPNNVKLTHTTLGNKAGSFDISGDKCDKFMKTYCEVVFNKEVPYITECHLQYSPILIDIDIKYNLPFCDNNHRYSQNDIESIIKIYNKHIESFFNIPIDEFEIYLLEKEHPTFSSDEDGVYKYKDGVHIMYPKIWSTPNIQFIIRDNVINEFKKSGELNKLVQGQDLKDVFDEAVIERNNWLMYGSAKPNFEKHKYELTRIYNKDMTFKTINELSVIEINDLPRTLSIRQFKEEDELAKLNSNYTWERIEQIYNGMNTTRKRKNADELRIAIRLCSMLSKNRSENYQKWIELGWCLHNIHDILLSTWIEISKYSSKFKEGDCEKKWDTFRDQGFTIRSLHRWAKHDSPSLYSEFILEENGELMKRSLTGTSYDVARAFYEIYKYDYVCTGKDKIWFEYQNHKWVLMTHPHTIITELNESMVNRYLSMHIAFSTRAMDVTGDEKSKFLELQQATTRIIGKLRSSTFKRQVIDELTTLFFNSKFLDKIDEERNLICFNNGVFDLENYIFRDGRPEDYITLCTNINYIPYDLNNEYVIKAEHFMSDVQPDEDMKNYVLDLMASCLQGNIPDEKFHIWTGTGGNGKSLSIFLLMQTLGEYSATLPITVLTNKRMSSGAADPEMAKTKGKRFCVFQEPEQDDKLYVGKMKELTSNTDKISARGLFKDPVEFYPQFKLLLACNDLPDIPSSDGGTWRRIRLVPFEMKFVDNPKELNEKKKNNKFKEEIPFMKEAFMSILIHRYKNYKLNGLKEPKKVTNFTLNYQKDSDRYLEFIEQNLVRTGSSDDVISIKNLHTTFKNWHKEFYNDKTNVNQKDLKTNLLTRIKNGFNKVGSKLIGYQFVLDDDMSENLIIEENNDIDSNTITINTNTISKINKKNTNTSQKNRFEI
jgi:P4 family phage/plasmid primase-like protien